MLNIEESANLYGFRQHAKSFLAGLSFLQRCNLKLDKKQAKGVANEFKNILTRLKYAPEVTAKVEKLNPGTFTKGKDIQVKYTLSNGECLFSFNDNGANIIFNNNLIEGYLLGGELFNALANVAREFYVEQITLHQRRSGMLNGRCR